MIVKAICGKVFTLSKGVTLKALGECTVCLPGDILKEGETVGSILNFSSDDIEIGFKLDEADGSIEFILIKLRSGQSVSTTKAAQAFVVADEIDEVRFDMM